MWGLLIRRGALAVIAAGLMLIQPGSAWAGGPGAWTKLATLDNPADTAGMARTADGSLHLVWLAKRAGNGRLSLSTGKISLAGKLLATGTAVSNWQSLEPDPQLFNSGGDLRLVFEGNTGAPPSCFADAAVYTATSTTGSSWLLANGSMDFHTAGVGNLAATSELNGTPVALFAGGHLFHVGVDPSCPATSPDRTITPTAGAAQSNPALVTDPSTGAVWAAWFQDFNKMGYWIDPILPTQGAPIEAPHSASTAAKNNQPLEPVAIAARASGGIYMAYCATSSSQPCAHIDLWKVGSAGVRVVPGSHNVAGARVALAAGPGGRLSVIWYDAAKNMIHAVRTNTAGTSFGVLRSIKPPKHTSAVTTLQSQGSSGRLDVVVADELTTGPVQLLHTQILAGLSLTAKPSKFSHKKTKKVVFAASDAGQAVPAAKVSCLGKHGKSNAAGRVTLSFHKGEPKGKHVCTVSKAGYNAGKATVKVT